MKIHCLCLDKRYEQGLALQEAGKRLAEKLHIDVLGNIQLFIAGDGKTLPKEKYDYIDSDEMPPVLEDSTKYPTWYKSPNAFNAFKCHKKMIEIALQENQDYLWIMEDDAVFQDDFAEIYLKCESFINFVQWDALYLGWYSNGHLKNIGHEHVYRIIGGAGFHSVVLSNSLCKKLSRLLPSGPYDELTARFFLPEVNAFAIYPAIVTQSDGYSYIEGGFLQKPNRNHR